MEGFSGVDVTRGDDFEATIGSGEPVLFVARGKGTCRGSCGIEGGRRRRGKEGYVELRFETP